MASKGKTLLTTISVERFWNHQISGYCTLNFQPYLITHPLYHALPGDGFVVFFYPTKTKKRRLEEHHSNLVPWQLLAESTGAQLKFGRLTSNGKLEPRCERGWICLRPFGWICLAVLKGKMKMKSFAWSVDKFSMSFFRNETFLWSHSDRCLFWDDCLPIVSYCSLLISA